MRITMRILVIVLALAITSEANAALQNVEVGGKIRIRGNYFSSSTLDSFNGRNPVIQPFFTGGFPRPGGNPAAGGRYRPGQLFNRALGFGGGGGLASLSGIDFNNDGHSREFVEQRTLLNVRADFTNDVSAFIEIDSYDIWGEDFRSAGGGGSYITGADVRQAGAGAGSADDVEIYQAYIEANEMWGVPLRLRVGRQELVFGTGWLLGNNTTSSFFTGLSYDGVRLTYSPGDFSLDAFWARLVDTSPIEEDGDVDLMGLYGSYYGFEDHEFDVYLIWLRDGRQLQDTFNFAAWTPLALLEGAFGVDDYDPTNIYTVGLRGAGEVTMGFGVMDYNVEAAYQWGNADSVGFAFRKPAFLFFPTYGDDDAEFGQFAAEATLGMTFDVTYQPRVWVGGAYFGGEDERDLSFGEWLESIVNPFYSPDASVSFNRLFSGTEYSEFFTQLSNIAIARGGVDISPTESVDLSLLVTYYEALEAFEVPPQFFLGGQRFVPLAGLSFLGDEADTDLGWEVGLYAEYRYSEDLTFRAGWSHFFTGSGLERDQGNFVSFNGLGFEGGTDDDDLDYVFIETELSF